MSNEDLNKPRTDTTSHGAAAPATPATSALVAPAPSMAPKSTFDDVVEKWWNEKVRGSVVGRNTECWNYLHSAVDDLKERLNNLK